MATVRDLINGSLRLINVLAEGETASANQHSDALSVLNQMIESWSLENLIIYSTTREEFTLTVSDGSYTIGSSGDFNTTRPVEIERAMIEDQSNTPTMEYPLELITPRQWAEITTKDLSSSIPTKLYYDPTYPLGTLNLWPVPSVANKLVLYSKKALTEFTSINNTISLPPGYMKALRFNLAVELAPEYGKEASQTVVSIAVDSKGNIKRKNIKPIYLKTDMATTGNRTFNIYTGE